MLKESSHTTKKKSTEYHYPKFIFEVLPNVLEGLDPITFAIDLNKIN